MSKNIEKNNEIITFDRYKLESEIKNDKNHIYKLNNNAIFSLLEDNMHSNEEEYYVNIKNKKEQYIGVLTKTCKKELFGYILFSQGDEYLGQITKEKKHGFGIYKFKKQKKRNEYDIYIGEFFQNTINGEGIYINISKAEDNKNEKNKTKLLKAFLCSIGKFENGEFKKGKIYKVDNDNEKLEFKDYEKQDSDKKEREDFNFEKKGDVFLYSKGINKDNRLIEGSVIYVKDNDKIENKFTFKLNGELNYIFEYLGNEEKEKELLEEFQNSNFSKYNQFVQNLYNNIEKLISNIKNDAELKFGRNLIVEDKFKKIFSDDYNSLVKDIK